ncbi:TolB family protein [Chitinophaga qingshengii]|uniref:Uncharacterized protein n=1 Tax=Chitinophaga qingshengii TaxID=1569794 RepID=A0ABR7TKM3_9BACT|nr:hypothetical protein [Chitinophaga qingshengii]MBC9931037.1 hypothetical protein [Chitinophaga qingshengii]
MKKLVLGSFALLLFSASMLVFQISCKKSADAETPVSVPAKVVFLKYVDNAEEIWLMNYDGSAQTKVNVTLAAGQHFGEEVRVSPNGQKLFFTVYTFSTPGVNKEDIYSCDLDGKNLKKLYDMPAGNGHTKLGAVM